MKKSSFIMVIDIEENQEKFAPRSRIVLNSDHLNWISVETESKNFFISRKKSTV